MKRAFGICAVALMLALSVTGVFAAGEEKADEKKFGPNVGDYLKDFNLSDPTTAKAYTLGDFTKTGTDTAFVFMQTACSLCVSELQEILENKDEISGKLNVVLVSVDFDPKRIQPYKEAYKIPFTILHDPDTKLMDGLAFTSTPAMAVVNAKGVIGYKNTGYNKAEIKGLLKKYR